MGYQKLEGWVGVVSGGGMVDSGGAWCLWVKTKGPNPRATKHSSIYSHRTNTQQTFFFSMVTSKKKFKSWKILMKTNCFSNRDEKYTRKKLFRRVNLKLKRSEQN